MVGLQWSGQITVGDVLTFIGLLSGLIGLVFVYIQVRAGAEQARISAEQARISADQAQQTATAQRGRFVLDVINRYFDDPEMLRLHYLIDSRRFIFIPTPDVGSTEAAAISRTLYYFDTVKFLVDQKLISLEDVAILKYRIVTFFDNPQVKDAMRFIYSETRGGAEHAHVLAQQLYRQLKES